MSGHFGQLLAMCDLLALLARFGWAAMVARVGTTTATVAGLSDAPRTSCELIRVFSVPSLVCLLMYPNVPWADIRTFRH